MSASSDSVSTPRRWRSAGFAAAAVAILLGAGATAAPTAAASHTPSAATRSTAVVGSHHALPQAIVHHATTKRTEVVRRGQTPRAVTRHAAANAPAAKKAPTVQRKPASIGPGFGDTYTVNSWLDSHDASPGDRVCADALGNCTLRAAVEEANADFANGDGDSVVILPSHTTPVELALGSMTVTSFMRISGAGASSSLVNASGNGPNDIFVTSQGADLEVDGVTLENGTGARALDVVQGSGLTLTNSTISGNTDTNDGAGLYNEGSVVLTNDTFSNNGTSGGGGGAIYNDYGTLSISGTSTLFSTNSATGSSGGDGGALYNANGAVTIADATFDGNTATAPSSQTADGGAIYIDDQTTMNNVTVSNSTVAPAAAATATYGDGGGVYDAYGLESITNSTIENNTISTATGYGGGFYSDGATTLTGVTVSGNTVDEGDGGGIYNPNDGLVLVNTLVSGNSALDPANTSGNGQGGGIWEDSTITLDQTLVDSNAADNTGGGMYGEDGAEVNQSTFSNNTAGNTNAGEGGGVYASDGMHFTNSTIADNTVNTSGFGGGLYVDNASITVTLSFVTVGLNTGSDGDEIYVNAGNVSLGSSIVDEGSQAAGISNSGNDCDTGSGSISSTGNNVTDDYTCLSYGNASQSSDYFGYYYPTLSVQPLVNNVLPIGFDSVALNRGGTTCPAFDELFNSRPASNCDSGAYEVTQNGPLGLQSGPLGGAPKAVAPMGVFPGGQTDVFWRGSDNNLWFRAQTGTAWAPVRNLTFNHNMASDPHPVMTKTGTVDVFWKGTDGALWHSWIVNGTVNGPQSLGDGPLGSEPWVAANGAGQVSVFWKGTDNNLWEANYNSGWTGPIARGDGPLGSAPHPAYTGYWPSMASGTQSNTLEVFWTGTDSALWHDTFNGTSWTHAVSTQATSGAQPMGGAPQVISLGDGDVHVFWRGQDNNLWWTEHYFNTTTFRYRQQIGSSVTFDPQPVATSYSAPVAVFWRDAGGALESVSDNWGSGWTVADVWGNAPLGSEPSVVYPGYGALGPQIANFWEGTDKNLWAATIGY